MKYLKTRVFSFILMILIIFSLIPVQASSSHIYDNAGVLEASQAQLLEEYAQKITDKYQTGVYIVTVEDNIGDIQPAADHLYHVTYELGEGEKKNGIMLMVSVSDRDYVIIINGPSAEYAFSSYAVSELEKAFLPELKEDHWASAFHLYLEKCDEDLKLAAKGHPLKTAEWKSFLTIFGISCLISILICLILRKKNTTVHKKTQADQYTAGSLHLTASADQYTHTTTVRTKTAQRSSSTVGGSRLKTGKF